MELTATKVFLCPYTHAREHTSVLHFLPCLLMIIDQYTDFMHDTVHP